MEIIDSTLIVSSLSLQILYSILVMRNVFVYVQFITLDFQRSEKIVKELFKTPLHDIIIWEIKCLETCYITGKNLPEEFQRINVT